MTMMIRAGVPGHYVFFAGEEVGCIGSKALAEEEIEIGQYDHCVSFDRRGTNSIITHQCGSRTASDLWALDLAGRLAVVDNNLRYEPDPTGVFTDSREFADLIPECTNLSVGYLNQHTARERQDVKFLLRSMMLTYARIVLGSIVVLLLMDHAISTGLPLVLGQEIRVAEPTPTLGLGLVVVVPVVFVFVLGVQLSLRQGKTLAVAHQLDHRDAQIVGELHVLSLTCRVLVEVADA
jgi:hypothetical protein